MTMKPYRILAFLCLALAGASMILAAEEEKIELSVLLYPWVPDYAHIARVVETGFEAENPTIDLILADQNWDYYKPNGLDAKLDLYELDTIFLADFIAAGRVQALDPTRLERFDDSFAFAREASSLDEKIYGVPHWACALYLFYFEQDAALAEAVNLQEVAKIIGPNPPADQGLLIDMKGAWTLAEIYLDCLLDLGRPREEILGDFASGKLNIEAFQAMRAILDLVPAGLSRDKTKHDAWPPFYALAFGRGRGRAMVGYSERLYHILTAARETPAGSNNNFIDPAAIRAKLFHQGETARPFVWVDSFAVDASVEGKKLEAAYAFLNFMSRDATFRATLLPEGGVPLYLLPAYPSAYQDQEILEKAPMYEQFLQGLERGVGLQGAGLPAQIERVGQALDQALPDCP